MYSVHCIWQSFAFISSSVMCLAHISAVQLLLVLPGRSQVLHWYRGEGLIWGHPTVVRSHKEFLALFGHPISTGKMHCYRQYHNQYHSKVGTVWWESSGIFEDFYAWTQRFIKSMSSGLATDVATRTRKKRPMCLSLWSVERRTNLHRKTANIYKPIIQATTHMNEL